MPILKLRKHQATFSDEDILINPSDFPELRLKDVVELKPPKGGNVSNRILLQVRKWPEVNSYPNSVSIKDSVVNTHLKLYADVLVNIVDKKDVLVDSIEICFSNAYLARSYMWGLRNYLNNRCVYQRQKLDYLNIRSQICEIWAQGNKVSSGYLDDDSKIVFRSASSLVYLFIQMSSEMWDYDINGDLYCEKAINGFLTDLFDTWRRNDCSHDITIVLFSRTFYDAESLEEFPKEMRECLQVDYKNRFYEDCYRVAFQNDRFDLHDWNAKLTTLKSLFNQYQKEVIDRHQEKYDTKIPRAYNSSASQGNFLEVLNMSLNVFEKHYFDRSFDRTGQLSVVVSPGVGVFEVDFELTNLTKQRIIDNGIGSDLVCLGEQPLHTVPLLKFNSKSFSQNDNLATCDVYNMPHWINLSFYSSQNQVFYSNFVPRIKLPTFHTKPAISNTTITTTITAHEPSQKSPGSASETTTTFSSNQSHYHNNPQSSSTIYSSNKNSHNSDSIYTEENCATRDACTRSTTTTNVGRNNHQTPLFSPHSTMPDLVDYDDYDAQVFKSNSMITYHCQQQSSSNGRNGGERSVLSDLDSNVDCLLPDDNEDDFLDRDNRNKSASVQRRSSDVKNYQEYSRNMKRQQMSENLPISQPRMSPKVQTTFARMSLVDSYLTDVKIKPESADDLSVRGYNVQSSRINRSSARPKALINPFDPSHMTIKLTPNRRRWTHVFPQGPTGTFIQQHHYQPVPQKTASPYLADVSPPPILEDEVMTMRTTIAPQQQQQHRDLPLDARLHIQTTTAKPSGYDQLLKKKADSLNLMSPTLSQTGASSGNSLLATPITGYNKSTLVSNDTIRFAWCASGEQEWTPAITTGVDWKSLTMPACLPLTTDFFPSKTSLQNDYVIGEYTIDSNCIHPRYTLIEVYRELVCQRLQKGFQIILLPRQSSNGSQHHHSNHSSHHSSSHHHHHHHHSNNQNHQTNHHSQHHHHHHNQPTSTFSLISSSPANHKHHAGKHSTNHRSSRAHHSASTSSISSMELDVERERTEYTMSIGRIFHKLSLNGNTITVTQYRPRHPYPTIKIDYCYRFRAPFHENYGQSWVHFKSEKLENYSWNYLDNYICARGESFELRSSLKFWRFRILILPSRTSLRKLEGREDAKRHDIHHLDYSQEERCSLMESFIKLLEIINKTRRASASRMSNCSPSAPTTATSASASSQQPQSPASKQQQQQQQQQPQQEVAHPVMPGSRLSVQINNASGGAEWQDQQDKLSGASGLKFVSINMDIDSALRDAKRSEWVHVQYHCYYDLDQAFELLIKWMVASGAGIAEMVQGWSRKAGKSSVHVVPIPWEPFALPHSGKADPLRCPIGIQLRLECLPASFEDLQVIHLQERILRRFGFLPFHDLVSSENIERQFVHMSGFAFVALPNLHSPTSNDSDAQMTSKDDDVEVGCGGSARSPTKLLSKPVTGLAIQQQQKLRARPVAPSLARTLEQQDTISSPHEEYITRHIDGARQPDKANMSLRNESEQIEFIWSWNYMLTKRWRSPSTQDESYAVALMQDFKDFCQNGQSRLLEFWQEVRESL